MSDNFIKTLNNIEVGASITYVAANTKSKSYDKLMNILYAHNNYFEIKKKKVGDKIKVDIRRVE